MPPEPSEPPAQVASVPHETAGQSRRGVVGGMSWRDTFAALKHRNFRLFFVGQLVSLTGTWMQSTAQGWLVYQLTGSKVLLGTVAAVGTLPMLLLSLWGGSVADRHSKRTVVLYTQTGMMLTAFVFAALVGSWPYPDMGNPRVGGAGRCGDGLRHARPAGVHGGNDHATKT